MGTINLRNDDRVRTHTQINVFFIFFQGIPFAKVLYRTAMTYVFSFVELNRRIKGVLYVKNFQKVQRIEYKFLRSGVEKFEDDKQNIWQLVV